MSTQILALCGSQRTKSWSAALLCAAKQLTPSNVDFHIFEEHKQWPLFNPDLEHDMPASVQRLRGLITTADAVVICSPEYAHGVTGTIKNTLDWLVSHPEFAGKPVAVFNPAYQSSHADEALKETLRTMAADLIADACVRIPVIGSGIEQDAIGNSPKFAPVISAALQSVIAHVRRTKGS